MSPDATDTLPRPHQKRSQETMQRLVDAASRLLDTRNWADISITDLVREARSSVGSFYHLFGDKDGLLDYLDELYTQDMLRFTREFGRTRAGEPGDLRAAVRALVEGLVAFHRKRRGTVRALVLRARRRREPAFDQRTRRMNQALPALLDFLQKHRPEIRHPRVERACFLAFSFTFSALRDRILFPESVQDPSPADDRELVDELSRAMLSYLCWADAAHSGERKP